jgi:DNA segregation ATPase FtsK/SpoIIIE, S-DNA-T family
MARVPRKSEVTRFKRVEPSGPATATRPARARRNGKSTTTKTAEPAVSNHPHLKAQVLGSVVMLVALWLFLALVLGILREKDHPLGPWLGRFVADVLAWFFGGFPGLLIPFVLALLGARIVAGAHSLLNRALVTSALIWVHLVLFLCLPGLYARDISNEWLSHHSGALGQFLVEAFLGPVFGAHALGPALIFSATFLGTMFFLFRLTPREAMATGVGAGGNLLSKMRDRLAEPRTDRLVIEAEKELLAGGALALGVEPRGRFLDRQIRPEPEEGILPMPGQAAPAPKARQGRTPLVPGAVLAAAAASPASAPIDPDSPELAGKALEVYNNLSSWRPLRPEDLLGLNPLEIRELKRRDEELRRAAMLNEWEDRDVRAKVSRRPQIATDDLPLFRPDAPKEPSGRRPAVPEPEDLAEVDPGADDDDASLGTDPAPDEAAGNPVTPKIVRPVPPRKPVPPKPSNKAATAEAASRYRIPDVSILPDPPAQDAEVDEEALKATADRLVLQLKNFNVSGKVLQIEPGPVITRFKVELAPGTPVRKISNLSEDLALALRAKRIRIQAPIPGEAFVGVEIPNLRPETVYIKELLRSPQFRDPKLKLPVVLGKDTSGHPAFTDLSRAPHLLIAGQTGSGKSVCINTILTSLLFSQSPERLRMILIDPKVVELSTYSEIPHLMAPVVTKPEEAVQALKWTAVEMDRRYDVLAAAGTRNIAGFNDKMEAGILPESVGDEDRARMPYLLLIIDEFADLMMVAGKEVETNVARIAQKARAVGIHMILATQRPSTNVITGVIKANLPTRIAFQVASQIDARTIMEHQGAEELLGRGDMLFRGIEAPEPMRVHGAFVSDAEAEAAALSASSQGVVFPMVESFDLGDGGEDGDEEGEAPVKFDAKFGEAARLVALTRQGSVSMLQRRLEVGFARAGRLMDQLERMGIVGRDRGSKAREVLMDEVQVEDLCRRLEEGY